MNNAHRPVNPTNISPVFNEETGVPEISEETKFNLGLTKREYFTGLAMQTLVTADCSDCQGCAAQSVEMADALLLELEK